MADIENTADPGFGESMPYPSRYGPIQQRQWNANDIETQASDFSDQNDDEDS